MEVLMRGSYCFECSQQFDNKHVFDIHLSASHGEKIGKKQEYDSQVLVNPKTKELEIKHQHEGKEQFKCDICEDSFGGKVILNQHVATVHEG